MTSNGDFQEVKTVKTAMAIVTLEVEEKMTNVMTLLSLSSAVALMLAGH